MSWKGERGLRWPAGGVGGHYELERGEGAEVACWRGWQSYKDLGFEWGGGHFFVCDRFIIRKVLYQKGSVSDRFGI
jgi:hypothetical protein